MLFVNNNCGKGNRTVTKYMVNVNAYHKEGFYFIFYDTIRERPSCASNKWQICLLWLLTYGYIQF